MSDEVHDLEIELEKIQNNIKQFGSIFMKFPSIVNFGLSVIKREKKNYGGTMGWNPRCCSLFFVFFIYIF